MFPEVKHVSTSHKHWKLNWWDLWPLVDGEKRPIQWTSNSLILSPHPSSPVVLARSFPSSSPFGLPSPIPVANNPAFYSPPSIIEVSPLDDYIFAYFQGINEDSIACIWHREETVEAWKPSIFWQIKAGQGIVLAKWLGEERMWLHTSPPTRAPPLGPSNHFGRPTLLLVNQCHTMQIVHRTSASFSFQLISASLRHASQVNVGDRPVAVGETTNGPGGLLVCAKAAIGLGYNESSIIVATSSTLIPTPCDEIPNAFTVPRPSTPPPESPWETYGPENIIHLCEVKLTAYGYILGVSTAPLPPLFPPATSSSRLTNILILPHLPATDYPSSPEGSVVETETLSSNETSGTLLYTVLTYLDFEDYSSPRSEMMCFELKRNKTVPVESSKSAPWSHRLAARRTIASSAVSFILAPRARVPGADIVLTGLLDLDGIAPRASNGKERGKPKEAGIGKVVVLKIPQLEDAENWEPSRLMSGSDEVDVDPPLSATVSPAGSLICTSPSTRSNVSELGVNAHPRRISTDPLSAEHLTESLLSALLSNTPPTDVLHALINPAFPLSSTIEVLERTLRTLDSDEFAGQDWHGVILGTVLDIFRARSKRMTDDIPRETSEKAALEERWHVALDLCSVRAIQKAFEACQEDDGYDLEPVWQLIALSTWLVDFSERLVRACVMSESDFAVSGTKTMDETTQENANTVKVKMEAMEVDGNDLFDGELSPAPEKSVRGVSPNLIHILHPYALDNLIGALFHLNAFRTYLDTLKASAMKASIAKDVVVDVIDCSGINFKELESTLRNLKKELSQIDAYTLRGSFCLLSPLPSTHELLLKACKIISSPSTVSKPRLFIKPSDLVDGISKLNLAAAKMNQERDIISKGVLGAPSTARMCVRCKGKTETGQTPPPRGRETNDFGRWAVWEHEWERCICGGLWVTGRAR